MNDIIKKGDYARHKNPILNNVLQMSVIDIDESNLNAKCGYFAGADSVHQENWFPISDLILIRYGDYAQS